MECLRDVVWVEKKVMADGDWGEEEMAEVCEVSEEEGKQKELRTKIESWNFILIRP